MEPPSPKLEYPVECPLTSHLFVAAAKGFHAYVAHRTAKRILGTVVVNAFIFFTPIIIFFKPDLPLQFFTGT